MDKETAAKYIASIETHRANEAVIWQQMRLRDDYEMHEDKAIADILEDRRRARDLQESADSALDAFDWVDDGGGNLTPRGE